MLTDRLRRHERVSGWLADRDDDELTSLLDAAPTGPVGVGGGSSVLDVDGVRVFAKRVPLTDRELARPQSTANLFDVPLACQYGMYPLAGPGFSAWRELEANRIVTAGVLAGEADSFPLLHDWRVLPGRPPVAPEHRDIEPVVAQFGDDPGVRSRLQALAAATSSLVLFSEYVPRPLTDWLADPVDPADPAERAEALERQLLDVVAFLRDRELLHLDGHFGNMRADDQRIYLCDFGLATSPRFELSDAEREFAETNAGHDADYAAMRLVNWLATAVCGAPAATPVSGGAQGRDEFVRRCADGDFPPEVPALVAVVLERHAPAAARMNAFCARLFDGDLDARYPGTADTGR